MTLEVATCTHLGDRSENEDCCAWTTIGDLTVLCLADGMGGHSGGAYAARSMCAAMTSPTFVQSGEWEPTSDEWLRRSIEKARLEMCAEASGEERPMDPHTTLAAAWLRGSDLTIAHIGDSRAYVLDVDGPCWHTRDHSIAELMVGQGELTPDEVATDATQSQLYRSISCKQQAKPSIARFAPLGDTELLVLCSDGFWQHVASEEMLELRSAPTLQDAVDALALEAVRRASGDADNTTVVAARVI